MATQRDKPFPRSPNPARAARFRRLAAGMGVSVGLLAVTGGYFARPWVEGRLLAHWQTTIVDFSEDEARGAMRQAVPQGRWGLRLLLAGLDSPADNARLAAAESLHSLLRQWREDTLADHADDVIFLARQLAVRSENFTPTQMPVLQPLIDGVANWRIPRGHSAAPQFVADCELLIRRAAEAAPRPLAVVARASGPSGFTPPPLPLELSPPPQPQPQPPQPNLELKSPPAPKSSPPPSYSEDAPIPAPPLAAPPSRTPTKPIPRPQEAEAAAPQLMLEMLPNPPEAIRPMEREKPPTRPLYRKSSAVKELDWRGQTDWYVIQFLHHDATAAHQAEQELIFRGYRSLDVAIARRASHPEAAVRLKLAEDLPRMAGIHARPWLTQLAEDSDAAVQKTARGILETAREPDAKQQRR